MIKDTLLQNATGPVEFKLTNDYLFRAVCQKNKCVLKGLVCSLLGLAEDEIRTIEIQNPIHLGEAIHEKDIILDLDILLNNNQHLNIEMQVVAQEDWPKRSLYYLCRTFCSLCKGDDYSNIMPTLHIGILDFTLFPEEPEFYARNRLSNIKTHQVYSSKFGLNVLHLKCINLATNEDKACKLDYWAKLFKATTWEEIKMLAEQNNSVHEAAVTMRELTADDKIRLQCEARERYEMDRRSLMNSGIAQGLSQGIEQGKALGAKEQKKIDDAIIAKKDSILKEQAVEIATLRTQMNKK